MAACFTLVLREVIPALSRGSTGRRKAVLSVLKIRRSADFDLERLLFMNREEVILTHDPCHSLVVRRHPASY